MLTRPNKMPALQAKPRWLLTGGGRLREPRPYWVIILPPGEMVTVDTYPMFKMFYSCEKSF